MIQITKPYNWCFRVFSFTKMDLSLLATICCYDEVNEAEGETPKNNNMRLMNHQERGEFLAQ